MIRTATVCWNHITTSRTNAADCRYSNPPMWKISSKFCDGQSGSRLHGDADDATRMPVELLVNLLRQVQSAPHHECVVGEWIRSVRLHGSLTAHTM